MKTCKRNSCSVRVVVRFAVFIAMVILVLAAEGAKNNHDYNFMSKPRPKLREIRAFKKPHSLYTAIGFGKRSNEFQSTNLQGHDSMMLLPVTDDSQRFPIDWFVQLLMNNPELANKVERKLLYDDEGSRSSSSIHRVKKNSNEDTYYFTE